MRTAQSKFATKRVKKKTVKKNDKDQPKRVWHRYHPETMAALHELREEIKLQIPFFVHGHIDDPSIITALIHKAHGDMRKGKFNVQEYFGAKDVASEQLGTIK